MKVPPAPGPAKYDRVWVQQLGPNDATQVLVLVPGTQGGAGGITPVARDIVRRVPRTQVWIVDRREQAFEDTSVFAAPRPGRRARLLPRLQVPPRARRGRQFVSEWGLASQLSDLRSVVQRASAGGRRKVILGGHSAGASTAVAYAAWDFGGQPGYREIDGLVLIDGGLLGSFSEANAKRARQRAGRHPQRQRLPRPARPRPPRDRRDLRPGRRAVRLRAARRAVDAAGLPAAAGRLQAALPGHQRGAARLRLRREHLAEGARADPHPRRPARRERRPARLAGRRADADPPLRPGLRGQRPERDRVVLPAPPAARHRRRQRPAPDAGGAHLGPAAAARPPDRRAAVRVQHLADEGRRGARRAPAREHVAHPARRRSSTTAGPATSTRSRRRRGRTASCRPSCRS